MITNENGPSLKRLFFLALMVIIPVLFLLFKWAVVPASTPPSRSLFDGAMKK